MTRIILLVALCTLLVVSVAVADPGDTLWTRNYGGSSHDVAHSIWQTDDGGYIVAGYTESFGAGGLDFYVVRTDPDGDTVWTRPYGGSSTDMAYSVQETDGGGYVVAGLTGSFGAGSGDFYLVRIDADGDTIWTRTYGGASNEEAYSLDRTDDGGYVLGGYTGSFGIGGDFYLVRTDSVGDTLWTRAYGGPEGESGNAVQQTADDGYIIVGMTGSFGAGGFDFYAVKTDAGGDTVWTRAYGGAEREVARAVQQTGDGGYIIGGVTESFGAGGKDFYIIKTDASGQVVWTKTYGGSNNEDCHAVQQTDDGGYAFAGYSLSFGNDWQFYLVRTDASGDTLWTRTYGGASVEDAQSIQQTEDHGFVLAGRSYVGSSYDFYVVKTVPEGVVEMACDDFSPWFCRGKNFYFSLTVTNTTGQTVSGPLTFSAYSGYDCDPANVMVTISKNKTFNPGVTENLYFFKAPNAAAPGEYSASVDGTLGGFELFCCMNTEIRQCSPWRTGDNTVWELVEVERPEFENSLPASTSLSHCYPNPFNASTVIDYQLPLAGEVKLEVYNISGQKIATLVDAQQEAGCKSVIWDASEVSSGVYFYKLTAGDCTETKRMVLVK